MSYRSARSRNSLRGGGTLASRMRRTGDNYSYPQGQGGIRHEATFDVPFTGDPTALALGDYFVVENAQFIRSNSAIETDEEPVPTVSNNLASPKVMNGSSISEFSSNVRLKNQDTNDTVTLDVFDISLSFYDAHIWDTIFGTHCPVEFNLTNAPNLGEVTAKAVHATDFTMQEYNNTKFQQHYASHLGSITIGHGDGDNVMEFKQNRIPSKCRRSQTGMYWATIYLYDSTKNTALVAEIEFNQELNFKESRSSNRIVNFPE